MHGDDLRRHDRVSVCCRVDVQDRFGVWTAITEDVCARGCRILTRRLPALGSLFTLRLSSDLFAEELEVQARVVWGTPERIGVSFIDDPPRRGALSPAEWLDLVLEHGRPTGPGICAVEPSRVVPVITPTPGAQGRPERPDRAAQEKVIPLSSRSG